MSASATPDSGSQAANTAALLGKTMPSLLE